MQNLASMIRDGGVWSDAEMILRGGPTHAIGMSGIKERRLSLPVKGHSGLMVGACVPFYLCPRSIMLFLLYMGNHPELTYRGGQQPIIHLEADLLDVVDWANANAQRWAFSLANAGALYTDFRTDVARLCDVDWSAVHNRDFRSATVKEGKQAEFLIERFFPLSLVNRIGVHSVGVRQQVYDAFAAAPIRPQVQVVPEWYF